MFDDWLLIAKWRTERPDEYWACFARYITYYRMNRHMSHLGRSGPHEAFPQDPDWLEHVRILMSEAHEVLGKDYDRLIHLWCNYPGMI